MSDRRREGTDTCPSAQSKLLGAPSPQEANCPGPVSQRQRTGGWRSPRITANLRGEGPVLDPVNTSTRHQCHPPSMPWPPDAHVSLCHDPMKLLLQQSFQRPLATCLRLKVLVKGRLSCGCLSSTCSWRPAALTLPPPAPRGRPPGPHAPPPLPRSWPPGRHACLRLSHSPGVFTLRLGLSKSFQI